MIGEQLMVKLHGVWHESGRSVTVVSPSIPKVVFFSGKIVALSLRPG
jgi:ABC-type nitrate/sulfonate/bicarbonate transport system ATPase subunit